MIHFYIIPLFSVVLIAAAVCIVRYVTTRYFVPPQQATFDELISCLTLIINTEIAMYEQTIFRHKGAITNSNYENFYNDLVTRILDAIPERFYLEMSRFMTKEEVVTIICHKIHSYLRGKATKIK